MTNYGWAHRFASDELKYDPEILAAVAM